MPEQAIAPNDLTEHPAVQAWCALHAGVIPGEVQTLKNRKDDPSVVSLDGQRQYGGDAYGEDAMVYRLCGAGPKGCNVIAKRCPRQNGLTESLIYEKILPRLPFATLQYYGTVEEKGSQFYWLFIEDAAGAPYRPEAEEHGVIVAEWLGRLHTCGVAFASELRLREPGPKHYWQYLQSARDRIGRSLSGELALKQEDKAVLSATLTQCDIAEQRWSRIEEYCDRAPRAFVHGDSEAEVYAVAQYFPGLFANDGHNAAMHRPSRRYV